MKRILQGFKRLLKRKERLVGKTYICDPARNIECSKEACWYIVQGPCRCTLKKKCAKLDEKGKPVIATEDEMINFEWMELQIATQKPLLESQER